MLVLDDFNLLRSREALETIAALIDDEAEGSMLVAATRVTPTLPLARSVQAAGCSSSAPTHWPSASARRSSSCGRRASRSAKRARRS